MTDNIMTSASHFEDQNNTVVSIQNVSLHYEGEKGNAAVLQNVNLDIHNGDFVCVLGPSGCGKSTLLNVIAGFHQPTEGRAMMGDSTIISPDWSRGVVCRIPMVFPWITVYDNIAYVPKHRNIDKMKAEERIEQCLDFFNLNDFRRKKPHELSDEIKQRVSLARVLANQPEIMLMDDPFSTLDILTRGNMQTLTREIWKKMCSTFFFVTHDVDEALSLATRIIIMSACPGRIVREFHTGFTHDISGNNKASARYSKEYMEIREEILDAVNSQSDDVSSDEI